MGWLSTLRNTVKVYASGSRDSPYGDAERSVERDHRGDRSVIANISAGGYNVTGTAHEPASGAVVNTASRPASISPSTYTKRPPGWLTCSLPDRRHRIDSAGHRWSRGSAPDHGRRRDERQHPGAADGDRRGRRVLPDADQRRHDHAAGPVRAAHGPLPRLPERLVLLRRRAGRLGRHQHRRQLHLLLPRAGRRHLLLALPHHAARAPADGHGRADLRASAAEPRAGRQQPLRRAASAAGRPAHRVQFGYRHPVQQSAAGRSTPARPTQRPSAAAAPASTPTTTATARPATTSSTRSRSTASTPTSTSSA